MLTQRSIGNFGYAVLAVAAVLMVWACAPKLKVEVAPEPPPAVTGADLYAAGERLMAAAAYAEAAGRFGEYLDRFPDGPLADAAMGMVGRIHMTMKRYADARRVYGQMISRFPDSPNVPEALLEILAAYFYEGKYEVVVRAFADIPVARFTPDQAKRADLYLGDAYWIMGRPPEAAAAYVRAFLNAPDAEKDAIRSKISEALRIMTPPEIASLAALMASDPDPAARELVETLAEPYAYDRFTLGCVLPLTGRYASYGNRALKGVELALARITRRPNRPDFRIVIKDTGGDPERAARAVRELARENRAAAVIGSLITAETAALEAQMAGIPIVTMTQKEGITQIGDYVFRNFFTPEMQVRTLVDYCSRTLGLDRFAILYPDEPYGKTFMNLFWDAVLDANGTIVGVEAYDKNRTDFADPIKKLVGLFYELPVDLKHLGGPPEGVSSLSGSGFDAMLMDPAGTWAGNTVDTAGRFSTAPGTADASETPEALVDFDAVFIPDAPKKSGLIIPQLAYYDVRDTYLLGTNLWYSQSLIEMTRQDAQGALMPVGFFPKSGSETVRTFVADFTETYGEPPGFIEAIAYDTAAILLETAGSADVLSRQDLRDTLLAAGEYHGVTGPTSFTADGDVTKRLHLIRIKGGEFVELDTQ